MSDRLDVVALVGSLRRDSLTRRLVDAIVGVAPAGMAIEIVPIGDLPLYNADLEQSVPAAWTAFRDRVRRADAVLFATPEYNRSVPGALKNAIDVGSRPYGKSVFSGKPAAVVSCSPGALGAFGANHHLRQSLVFLDMPAMQQPEAYVSHVDKLLGANGGFADDNGKAFMTKFITAFESWIRRHPKPA